MGVFKITRLRAFRCNKCLVASHRKIITWATKVRLAGEEVRSKKLQKWLLEKVCMWCTCCQEMLWKRTLNYLAREARTFII